MNDNSMAGNVIPGGYDTSTDERFYKYYEERSESAETQGRFERLVDLLEKAMARHGREGPFDVADVGGGAGSLSRFLARGGHRPTCIELSADLLDVGRQRAQEEGLEASFINCSATEVPLPDNSFDLYVLPELLEHVADWEGVLDEAARLTRPGGALFLSTTNSLCPKQDEFNLPLYSWYPGFMKRRYERLSVTTRPEIVNYTKYPAVNWFTYYSLRAALRKRGFTEFHDRVDMIEMRAEGTSKATIAKWLRRIPLLPLVVQFGTTNSIVLAFKPEP